VFRVGEATAEHEGYAADGKVTSMAFTPDGRLVLGHYRGHVAVVRPGSDNELVARLEAHRGIVHAVAVAPDGKSFASGAEDGQILIWPL
jgi:WD40 repeat protein